MNRNVTAIYRTHAVAELVRNELTGAGISASNVHVVPDSDHPVRDGEYRDDDRYHDQLHDLGLPDNDLRTYQQCVRNGDHVVSAVVDDELVDRARQIMARPEDEARNFTARDGEFFNESVRPHSNPDARRDRALAWQPDDPRGTGTVRSYRRDAPASRT